MTKPKGDVVIYVWHHPTSDGGWHLEMAGSQRVTGVVTAPLMELVLAPRTCAEHGEPRFLNAVQIPLSKPVEALLSLQGAARARRASPAMATEEMFSFSNGMIVAAGSAAERNWLAIEVASGLALALRVQWTDSALTRLETLMHHLPAPSLARRPLFAKSTRAALLMGWAAKFRHRGEEDSADENEKKALREIRALLRLLQ